ncbi:endospore germination permease [Bacillaceae bacterium Marseille-Q3522]|nr:endospore germination permease [Bacillaceae bacterium Marseille-Q3522]
MELKKTSSFQMTFLVFMPIISTAVLTIPSVTFKHAGRDLWISPILASVSGMFTAFIVYRLHKLFPNETIIQYSRHIVGGVLGKVIGFIYLFYFLYVSGLIEREYADFVIISFLPNTPLSVVIGSIVLVSAFAVRSGLEVLGRISQLFFPIYMLPFFLLLLLIPDFDVENMLPILEKGIGPPIRGAIQPALWFNQVFLISMLLPFLTDREKGRKWSLVAVFVGMLTMLYLNFVNLFLFGESISTYTYPVFYAFRYISVATFFERFESVVIVIWVMGVFLKLSVFYYVLSFGTAQILQLTDHRPFVYPLGLLMILFGLWASPGLPELVKTIERIIPFAETFVFVFIPFMLLLLAKARKKKAEPAKRW